MISIIDMSISSDHLSLVITEWALFRIGVVNLFQLLSSLLLPYLCTHTIHTPLTKLTKRGHVALASSDEARCSSREDYGSLNWSVGFINFPALVVFIERLPMTALVAVGY